jgi:predicted GTPase
MWFTRKGSKAIFASPTPDAPPNYWTDRDKAAWKVVEAHAAAIKPLRMDQLGDTTALMPYTKEAEALALKVAQIYRPGTEDPAGHLTIPEILTCAELVATDMSQLVDKYVPGSSFLTISHMKMARKAADYYQTASNIYWVVSAAMNPLKTVVQYAGSQLGLQPGMSQIQNNALHWFFLTFVHQLGHYLIELNSGRLKVGAKRYRELMAKHEAPPTTAAPPPAAAADIESETRLDIHRVTVSVVGPVKAGKSSLINAIFGETRTAVAQVPLTAASTRYDLDQAGLPPLSVMDTIGFGVDGPTDADIANAMEAAKAGDVLVLALPARSAARAPEVQFLDRVREAFARQPQLKMPPVVVALTHIDQLTPAMEWAPPYDWPSGVRPKEKSIREAVAAVKETFGAKVMEVVPVCGAAGKEYGVREVLVPVVAKHLDDARGVGLLRALHLEGLIDHTKKTIGQLVSVGKELWKQFMKK